MKFLFGILALFFLLVSPAYAQVENDNNAISLYANVCEKITNGESRSSARMRASDKASFKAVENIVELKPYKDEMDSHNFNLKVYKLVDNHLEDIKINVTSQSDSEVCIEVSAFVNFSSIQEVFASEEEPLDPIITKDDFEENEEMFLDVEDEYVEDSVNITIPPKPQITINENIEYKEDDNTMAKTVSSDIQTTKKNVVEKQADEDEYEGYVKVFVDKTTFYDNSETNGFFSYIKNELNKKTHIKTLNELSDPDYIIKTKVLKARVDNINSQTLRLQIVVAVDLINTQTSKTITEHQNRFVLYNSTDDSQEAASNLTKKLLIAATRKIIPHIKDKYNTSKSGNIITPH